MKEQKPEKSIQSLIQKNEKETFKNKSKSLKIKETSSLKPNKIKSNFKDSKFGNFKIELQSESKKIANENDIKNNQIKEKINDNNNTFIKEKTEVEGLEQKILKLESDTFEEENKNERSDSLSDFNTTSTFDEEESINQQVIHYNEISENILKFNNKVMALIKDLDSKLILEKHSNVQQIQNNLSNEKNYLQQNFDNKFKFSGKNINSLLQKNNLENKLNLNLKADNENYLKIIEILKVEQIKNNLIVVVEISLNKKIQYLTFFFKLENKSQVKNYKMILGDCHPILIETDLKNEVLMVLYKDDSLQVFDLASKKYFLENTIKISNFSQSFGNLHFLIYYLKQKFKKEF